jgi:SAM-dependent methyltransferase
VSPLPEHVTFPDDPVPMACPACGARQARSVYGVEGIPANSCVLLDDQAAARAYPTGNLLLAWCPPCGFLFNAAFDSARIDYSEGYEETQGCSPTFNAWLEGVIAKLLERLPACELVVEVGCGRGDFLELLCQRAGCRGIGVDPSGTSGRVNLAAGAGLEFLRAHYGPEHAHLPADLLVCRHTLEHLAPVAEVARLFQAGLAQRPGARVFIEVPDVRRVLEEGAFWDLYYEHCSYFSAGSLARLLRSVGFEPQALEVEYDGQYLQLLARRTSAPTEPADIERDQPALTLAVERFRATCRASLERWHGILQAARQADETLVLWGSGSKATGFLTTLGAGDTVRAVVDINPAKHGRFVAGTGHAIVAPEDLSALAPDQVVVMNPVYLDEIRADLGRMGVDAKVCAV